MWHSPSRLAYASLALSLVPELALADTFFVYPLADANGTASSNASASWATISIPNATPTIIPVTYDNPLNLTLMNATTHDDAASIKHDNSSSMDPREVHPLRARQNLGRSLRILPVGDSITNGALSSDGNGYRLFLRNALVQAGYDVDFVGALNTGDNNPDNQNEGYGGFKIEDIETAVKNDKVVFQHPNIVLIHAGTNDLWQTQTDDYAAGAPGRLNSLIEAIACEDWDAIVVVAQIVGSNFEQGRVDTFNAAIPGVVQGFAQRGYKIRVADMTSIRGNLLADGIHPTDQGYADMAEVWFNTFKTFPARWFSPPRVLGTTAPGAVETCARDSITWTPVQGGRQIALGAHVDGDAGVSSRPHTGFTFTPAWSDAGNVAIGIGKQGGYRMADINGDGRADYLWVDPGSGAITAYLNDGLKQWASTNDGKPIALGVGPSSNVILADMNGDHRVDYLYIQDNVINIFWNLGPVNSAGAYDWGGPATIRLGDPVSPFNLVVGDVDGDGCADYLTISADKRLKLYYTDCSGQVKSAVPISDPLTSFDDEYLYTLIDVNGDGYDDLCITHTNGGVTVAYNAPSPSNANRDPAEGLKYRYNFALGVGAPGSQVILADYDGDKKADYYVVNPDGGQVNLYLNVGSSSASTVSDISQNGGDYGLIGFGAAVRLADLDGDGRDDYIAVGSHGDAVGYINGGQFGDSWSWQITSTTQLLALGFDGAAREDIHFADLNGDGKADYIIVNPDNGAVRCYLNTGRDPSNGGVTWQYKGQIADGVGKTGYGVRFADISGDGRADYIWLDPDGRATVWLNTGSGDTVTSWFLLNNGDPVATGVGGKREEIRFADIDGDGKADYIWVDPGNGAAQVYYSGGQVGNSWSWIPGGYIATGIGYQGKAIRYARIGTSGRADYVAITEASGALVAFYNNCGKVIGGGSGSGSSSGGNTCGNPANPPLAYPQCRDSFNIFCEEFGCDDPPFVIDDARAVASRRSVGNGLTHASLGSTSLVRRVDKTGSYGGNSRDFILTGLVALAFITSLTYPDRQTYLHGTPAGDAHQMLLTAGLDCEDTEVTTVSADDANGNLLPLLPPEWETPNNNLDHPFDLQTMSLFMVSAITGVLPSGRETALPLIDIHTFDTTWRAPNGVPTSNDQPFSVINDLLMHGYGDRLNFQTFVPVRNDINRLKGQLFGLRVPQELDNFQARLSRAANGDIDEYNRATALLHTFFATFRYLNDPIYLSRLNEALANIRSGAVYLQNHVGAWDGIVDLWDVWLPDFFQTLVNISYRWAYNALLQISTDFADRTDENAQELLALAFTLLDQLDYIQIPGHARPSNL